MSEDSLFSNVQVIYEDHETRKIIVINLVKIEFLSIVSINLKL